MTMPHQIYVTSHACGRAAERFRLDPLHARYELLRAIIFGKRWNMAFIYAGRAWCFNAALNTLKTVYKA